MNFKSILGFITLAGIVFLIYFGTATRRTFRPPWTIDYINPMAAALRQGRLYIPDSAMTYDLALYNGRWYMTWGALAAIVHIPLQLLVGGRYVPALYTSLLFGSLTVGVVWLIFEQMRRDWFGKTPAWQTILFVLFYAFGTMQYYLSTVGSIWQVNQVVSTFFGVLGMAMILKKKRVVKDYFFSSVFCAIALLGRPTLGLLITIPLFLSYGWKRITATLLPISIAVVLVFVYNAVRFGNPLETGHRFLTEAPALAARRQQYGMLSLSYLPTNAWHMILAPPRISWKNGLTLDIDLMGNSIFLLSPIFFLALGTLPRIRSKSIITAVWFGIAITAAASLLYYNTGWMQFGYRYALDFSFLLVILSYIWLEGRLRWWMLPLFLYTLWVNYTGIRLLQ